MMEQRSAHEGSGCVSRRPGIGGGAIRAHLLGGVFDAIHKRRHDTIRHGGAGKKTRPCASSFHTCQLQTQHHCWTEILRVVINFRLEMRNQAGVGMNVPIILSESLLFTLGNDTRQEDRHSHKAQVIHHLIGFHTWVGLVAEGNPVSTHISRWKRPKITRIVSRFLSREATLLVL